MAYDPAKPAAGAQLSSAEMREQLQGLAEMIAAVPAGPPGPAGPSLVSAVVDTVFTTPSGSGSSATVSVDPGGTAHFTFTLVEGPQGASGEVSLSQLVSEMTNVTNNCLSQSSNNSNSVATLDTPMSSGEAELLRQKLNELISALRR